MKSLTWEQIRARRLAESHLAEPACGEHMVEVVSHVCGLQAQVLTAAEVGLGVRVAGITRRDVQAELWERRTLIKTYGPRGTIHVLPAGEMALWIAANRAVIDRENKPWHAEYGLDAEQAEAVLSAMHSALDGCCLTRAELADAVSQEIGEWARDRLASTWADLIGVGFDAGLLCFGPQRGSQVTFVRLDQWIAPGEPIPPQDALRILCRRYLRAYGPATPRDFAQWFAPRHLTASEAEQLMVSLDDELEEVEVEGRRCWLPAGETESSWEADHPTVLLLPQYDCYLLGSRFGRDSMIPEPVRKRVAAYKNGRFEGAVGVPVLLVDGVISGVWERKQRGKRVEIRVQSFVKLTPAQRDLLGHAVERIGSFLEAPVADRIEVPA